MLRKARQSNTTQQKDKAAQLAQSSYFEKIAASGGTRNLYHQLSRLCSYQLSYRGSSAGWVQITYTKQDNATKASHNPIDRGIQT